MIKLAINVAEEDMNLVVGWTLRNIDVFVYGFGAKLC